MSLVDHRIDATRSGPARLAVVLYVVPGFDRSMMVPGLRPADRHTFVSNFRFRNQRDETLTSDLVGFDVDGATRVSITELWKRVVTIDDVIPGDVVVLSVTHTHTNVTGPVDLATLTIAPTD